MGRVRVSSEKVRSLILLAFMSTYFIAATSSFMLECFPLVVKLFHCVLKTS